MATELSNVRAELSTLATMFCRAESRVVLAQTVRPEMFSDLGHRAFCAAMVAMQSDGKPIDEHSLEAWMTAAGTWLEAGGRAGLAKLKSAPMVGKDNLDWYAEHLTGLYTKRMILDHANLLIEQCNSDSLGPDELLALASQGVSDISTVNSVAADNSITYHDLMNKMSDIYDERIKSCRSGKPLGITTGFANLDSFTGGWKPGQLIVVASYTSRGKTVLAEQFSQAAAKQGKHVQLISLEMSDEELGDRAISRHSGVENMALQTGHIAGDSLREVTQAIGSLSPYTIEIMHRNNSSITEIVAYAKLRKMQGRCDVLIVDYLQIIEDVRKSRDGRRVEVAAICRRLKQLARDMSIPVILVSQLRRPESGGADTEPKPTLWMLKEAG